MIQTPQYFLENMEFGATTVEIRSVSEVCQGGPAIGRLYINGEQYEKGLWCGGPVVNSGNRLFFPIRNKKIFKNNFNLCWLDLDKLELHRTSVYGETLWVTRVSDNKVFYRQSVDESAQEKTLTVD